MCTHIVLPERKPSRTLSALPSTFCIDENQHNTQGAFGCALTLEQTILLELEKNFNLLVLLFCFLSLQCPPAAWGSRLEARFKLLQVHRCQRLQYEHSPAQPGDTLWPQLPQPHLRESYSAVRGGPRNDRGRRSLFHDLLPDNCQLSLANTISSLIKPLIKPVSDLTFIPPSICVRFLR